MAPQLKKMCPLAFVSCEDPGFLLYSPLAAGAGTADHLPAAHVVEASAQVQVQANSIPSTW